MCQISSKKLCQIIRKVTFLRDDRWWGFRITKLRLKLVHESSAVVHDLSAVRREQANRDLEEESFCGTFAPRGFVFAGMEENSATDQTKTSCLA
jgi:hypothetical protein